MVKYVPQYKALCDHVHVSEAYQKASGNEREQMDSVLEELKICCGDKIVPQLTLHESLILEIQNSRAFKDRSPEEQRKIISYVGSKGFQKVVDDVEAGFCLDDLCK